MAKLLLVIDAQYDFLENGKLGVYGATELMDKSINYIEAHGKDYAICIATVDWHPITHCSFKENGGMWPSHCIQYSHGAAIYEPILMALNDRTNNFEILTKGIDEDHEEYSIFKNKKSAEKLKKIVEIYGIDEIDVMGIALDVCVSSTIKDGKRIFPNVKWGLLKDYSPSINSPEDTLKQLDEYNVKIISFIENDNK